MNIWFMADQHYWHTNIIKYTNRPFRNELYMNEMLIANHNNLVKENDLVYNVGDFTFNPKYIEPLLKRLNGKQVLICGNHDKCHWTYSKGKHWSDKYERFGFAEVLQELILPINGQLVEVNHFPFVSTDDQYTDRLPIDRGQWLIHGHIHQHWKFQEKMINVGVDVWDYKPVNIEQLAGYINKH